MIKYSEIHSWTNWLGICLVCFYFLLVALIASGIYFPYHSHFLINSVEQKSSRLLVVSVEKQEALPVLGTKCTIIATDKTSCGRVLFSAKGRVYLYVHAGTVFTDDTDAFLEFDKNLIQLVKETITKSNKYGD